MRMFDIGCAMRSRESRSFISAAIVAVALAIGAPIAAKAQSAALAREASAPSYTSFIAEASARFGVPARWIRAVIEAESGGNRRALSLKGAMGLMQLMPATWASLATRYRLGDDPFDPRANILAGTAYLAVMRGRYRDLVSMLAAYNAGPARVDGWRIGARHLPAETIAYVWRVARDVQADNASLAERVSISGATSCCHLPFAVRGAGGNAGRSAATSMSAIVSIDGPSLAPTAGDKRLFIALGGAP
jgi:soluble lytic murein transglycosylase-like protein